MNDNFILIFTPFNPFPPRHGAHHRVMQQVNDLKQSYKILLASTYYTTDNPWPISATDVKSLCTTNGIEHLFIYEKSLLFKAYRLGHALLRRLYQLTFKHFFLDISSLLNSGLMSIWFRSISCRYRLNAVIIHYSCWAHLALKIKRTTKAIELHDILPLNKFLSNTISEVLESRECLSAVQASFGLAYIDDVTNIPLKIKKAIKKDVMKLNAYDIVWMISPREQKILHQLGLSARSLLIHPVADGDILYQTKTISPILPVGPNCFNIFSLLLFIEEVLPLIDSSIWVSNRIAVTGDFGKYDTYANLEHPLYKTGFIKDYKNLLARSSLMIVPTAVGTGQQIKIYEALSAGTPIILYRSSVPADLIDSCPSIIAVDSAEEFAQQLSMFLSDKNLQSQYNHLAEAVAHERRNNNLKRYYSESLSNANW